MQWTRFVRGRRRELSLCRHGCRRGAGRIGKEPPRRGRQPHQERDGPVPRPVRRLPRRGRARRPLAGPDAGLGVGADRRRAVPDGQGRHAEHGDAGATRACSITKSGRSWRISDARRAGSDRSAARQRRERAADVPRELRQLPSRQQRGRTPGPDLSRIGAARSRDAWSAESAARSKDFRPGYEPVTITPDNGQPIMGVKKNEDLFSVQIMDTRRAHPGLREGQR